MGDPVVAGSNPAPGTIPMELHLEVFIASSLTLNLTHLGLGSPYLITAPHPMLLKDNHSATSSGILSTDVRDRTYLSGPVNTIMNPASSYRIVGMSVGTCVIVIIENPNFLVSLYNLTIILSSPGSLSNLCPSSMNTAILGLCTIPSLIM